MGIFQQIIKVKVPFLALKPKHIICADMTASIRILTTSSLDSNPSLLIVSPNGSKTLINCGEGCQRSFLESTTATSSGVAKLTAGSVNRVCLTHIGHEAVGGLPGMILTTADVVDSVVREMQANTNKKRGGGLDASGSNNSSNDNRRYAGNNNNSSQKGNTDDRKRNFGSLISNDKEGTPDLEIVGPDGTTTFLHSLRHFMRRDRFKVHAHEGRYDSSLNKNYVSSGVTAKKKAKRKKSKGNDNNDNEEIGFNVKSIPISYDANCQQPKSYDESDPAAQSVANTKQAVSYLFTTPPIPGKFLIDKAKALNVPRGPMYAQLKAGKSVTFSDPDTSEERTVTSDEVVAKSSPGIGVAVIYCPTFMSLDELQAADTFKALEKGGQDPDNNGNSESELKLEVMVHLTPKSIFQDPAYQSWCKRFGTAVDHITLHATTTLEDRAAEEENSPFYSGICGGICRSFVNDKLFPMPVLSPPKANAISDDQHTKADTELNIIPSCPLMDYVLMPRSRRGLNKSSVRPLYSTNIVDKLKERVTKSGAVDGASQIIASIEKEEHSSGKEGGGSDSLGELIFTGTGSAIPCKHRNVTGMYLRMNNGNSMLLDVGEGTVGQLLRSWQSTTLSSDQSSVDEYRARLKGIKAVWISHPHADHHLGLLRLLSEKTAVCGPNDPIILMAPHDMFDFLAEYCTVAPEIKQSYIPVNCWDMIHGRINPLGNKLYDDLGITYCASIQVAHCLRSFAVVIDGTSFGRLAYSGDCRPSHQFADVACGSDLLIHEATFEIGMEEDAVLKRHSTVGEAIDVAKKMNAKSLVLTHFSQRYPKLPSLTKTNDIGPATNDIPITFAFDFLRLTPRTIYLASELTPALRLLYPREEVDEADMITENITAKELLSVPGVFAAKGVL